MARCSSRARAARPTARRSTRSTAAGRIYPLQLFAQGSRRPTTTSRRLSRHLPRGSHAKPDRPRCASASSDAPIHFDDLFLGAQHFDLATCGDVVVRAPRRPRELPARGGGRRCLPGGHARGARRRPAARARPGRSICSRRWRCRGLSTDTCRCCWNRTAPNYRNPAGRCRSIRRAAPQALISTLTHLSQAPPPELAHSSIKDVWKWAVAHWNPQALAGKTGVTTVRLRRQISRIEA